jgi:hypothetical protein
VSAKSARHANATQCPKEWRSVFACSTAAYPKAPMTESKNTGDRERRLPARPSHAHIVSRI